MSRLNSTIFSLKLKAENRNVKQIKIQKILDFLYRETDHTEKLKKNMHQMYMSEDFKDFYLNPDQFRQNLISTNPKLDLNDEDLWYKTKQLISKINPGELNPSTEELGYLISEIDWRSGGLSKKEKMSLKDILLNLYESHNDRFPNAEDLIEKLVSHNFDKAVIEKLKEASFSILQVPSSEDFFVDEEQSEKVFLKALEDLKDRGTVRIYARDLEFILHSVNVKRSLDVILQNSEYASEINKYSGDLEITLKTHKVIELMNSQKHGKDLVLKFRKRILENVSSGRQIDFSALELRQEYGVEVIKQIPEILKEIHSQNPIAVKIEKRDETQKQNRSAFILIISPLDSEALENDFLKEMTNLKL